VSPRHRPSPFHFPPLAGAVALAALLLLAGCASAPAAPAGLLEVIDLPGTLPTADPDTARAFLAEGDRAWEQRATPGSAGRARTAYWRAAAADGSLYDAYWKAALACERIGLEATDKAARVDAFERGAGIAALGIALDPDRAEAHYHYANNLGLLARERQSIGLDSLEKIVPHLQRAAELDPDLDDAGPMRTLALVYLRAPGWPTSVGDEEAGLEAARQAVARAPEHAGNELALAEALLANGERDEARQALERGIALALRDDAPAFDRDAWMEQARDLREKLH